MRRASSERPVSTCWANCLPSMARFSSDSITGSRDCASSSVKVFISTVYSEQWSVVSGIVHSMNRTSSNSSGGLICQPHQSKTVHCPLFTDHCFLRFQHPVQCNPRPMLHAGSDLDAVDHAALHQIFQNPGQVLRADAIHRRAQAAGVV